MDSLTDILTFLYYSFVLFHYRQYLTQAANELLQQMDSAVAVAAVVFH